MNCTRLPDETPAYTLQPFEYALTQGRWMFASPKGLLANLERHTVDVNPDGSITVQPSILVSNGTEQDHGFIENGIWRDV